MSFWDYFWLFFSIVAFFAYLVALWWIVTDLFRDSSLSGWWKAVWVVFLIIFPVLTALVYLIARGKGMAQRQARDAEAQKAATDAYIRNTASTSPADQIKSAKELLDAGVIDQNEFDQLKARALAS